jgi:anhydro-N-acetylmuramic acid kinase
MLKDLDQGNLVVVGLMSGTSLDGIDLAACRFERQDSGYSYELLAAETYSYSSVWEDRLRHLHSASAEEIFEADAALGTLYGNLLKEFIGSLKIRPQLIASHGHTLFHQPGKGFTTQIGSGAHIAAVTGIDTVCDFRSKDVALGGQGAPLVPVGDHFLFAGYEACLNLGGIANISLLSEGKRKAFDICPVNMALNELALRTGIPFDKNGELAATGNLLPDLLEQLNNLRFYQQKGAKSLGREWYSLHFAPLLENGSPADLSRTVCEHIAIQINNTMQALPAGAKVLTTGGGAFHQFLIERMENTGNSHYVIPEKELIMFKEAIVFAFLGALNYWGRVNVFDSATGSVKQHVGGALYRGD